MSLEQMQLIRDRLAADSCGVGTCVSNETCASPASSWVAAARAQRRGGRGGGCVARARRYFYMLKRVSADLGVHDDGLRKLISKVDANGDGSIQFSEFEAFVTEKEISRGPKPKMAVGKVCAIRERLRKDAAGIGSEISADTFFMWIKYTSSDLGVTDTEILDLIAHIDANGDRVIQKEEFEDFCNELIGV